MFSPGTRILTAKDSDAPQILIPSDKNAENVIIITAKPGPWIFSADNPEVSE
jgi:hypothetical protein